MVESNVYEPVASFIEQLMFKDKTRKYCIIIDSLDGLNIKGDLEKDYGDATKVAGAPLISKIFMRRISIYVEKRGHMIFLISQKTAEIQASAYAPSDPKMVNGAGGNAVVHFSNTILQYEHRYKKDDILKDPAAKPDMFTNPIVGHYARVTVKKSTTEQSHIEVTYPIKHKRVGNSIWLERELLEFLQGFGYIEKGGAWFNFSSDLLEELKKAGITPSETKFQGENRTLAFLEEQPALVKALRNIALSQLTNL